MDQFTLVCTFTDFELEQSYSRRSNHSTLSLALACADAWTRAHPTASGALIWLGDRCIWAEDAAMYLQSGPYQGPAAPGLYAADYEAEPPTYHLRGPAGLSHANGAAS